MCNEKMELRRVAFEAWFNANVENAKKSKYFSELARTTYYREFHKTKPQSLPGNTLITQNIDVLLYPSETVYEFTDPTQLIPLREDCCRERFADDGSLKAGIAYYLLFLRLCNPYRWAKIPMSLGDDSRIKGMFEKKNYDYNNELMKAMKKADKRQLIVYGAPGTGKSFFFQNETENNEVVRTTFHPDSDYSTFVGAYKPTMTVGGAIAYKFVAQAFMEAYLKAWKFMAEGSEATGVKPIFLIIEEINRGNCAQIFGDLFQLLDRNGNGWSDYPISADTDLAQYLKSALPDLSSLSCPNGFDAGNWERIKTGEMLALPPNLYIWATMNTSDQSLFPIDSAFKRRWDWKYVPIAKPDKSDDSNWKDRKIKVGETLYDWWDFLKVINKHIQKTTESEDKQLGYFFVKADESTGIISAEQFANKVLFYLYGDVFKSYELPKDAFKNDDGTLYSFRDFFHDKKDGDNVPGDVREGVLSAFLDNLKFGSDGIGKITPTTTGSGAGASTVGTASAAPAPVESVPAEAETPTADD